MLLRRVLVSLGLEHLQCLDKPLARVARPDHRVNVPALCGHIRIGKALTELLNLFLSYLLHPLALVVSLNS